MIAFIAMKLSLTHQNSLCCKKVEVWSEWETKKITNDPYCHGRVDIALTTVHHYSREPVPLYNLLLMLAVLSQAKTQC